MNTERTYPNNQKDLVELTKLLLDASVHVTSEFAQFDVSHLLEKIDNLENEIDLKFNLDSIFTFSFPTQLRKS